MIARKLISWTPAILWMVMIFTLSSRPAIQASNFDIIDFLLKKTAHFVEYFILVYLLAHALSSSFAHLSWRRRLIISLCISIAYAASDEFHQTFVTGREGRIRDVIIDASGAVAAVLSIIHIRRLRFFTTGI